MRGMARDGHLLIGLDDEEPGARPVGRDHGFAGPVAPIVEFETEPLEPAAHPLADAPGVFAGAATEHHGIESREGGALVIVGVAVSEMLISSAGIGYLISRYRTILGSAHVFSGVLLVLAMTIAFNAAIRWIERKASIWQTGTRGGQRAVDELASSALRPAT